MKDFTANIYRQLGCTNHSDTDRDINDFYATEEKAVRCLINEGGAKLAKNILEPSAGEGNIVKVLREYGYNVTARDIVQRTFELDGLWDFLQTTEKFDGDIVMNPPYKDALLHVNKALDICSGSVYALLKIQFLEGKSRYKELYSNGYLDHVYIFTGRTNCAKGNRFDEFTSSAVCYCWFKFNKHNKDNPATISWVNT